MPKADSKIEISLRFVDGYLLHHVWQFERRGIFRNSMSLPLSQIPVAILAGGLATRLRPIADAP